MRDYGQGMHREQSERTFLKYTNEGFPFKMMSLPLKVMILPLKGALSWLSTKVEDGLGGVSRRLDNNEHWKYTREMGAQFSGLGVGLPLAVRFSIDFALIFSFFIGFALVLHWFAVGLPLAFH